MPITNEGFEKYTEEEIFRRLEADLDDRLGATAEPGTLVEEQLRTEAETLAELYEESLEEVYQSAYLEDATGNELDKIVDQIGLSRKEAIPATGTATFTRDNIPTTNRVIPRGTKVQTNENNPTEFLTTELDYLRLIDNFSSGGLDKWGGETGSVSVVSASEFDGDNAVEVPGTSGTSIQTTNVQKYGSVFEFEFYPEVDSIQGFQFGYQDKDNYLEVVLDPSTNSLDIRMIEEGTEVQGSSENISVSYGQTLYGVLDWSVHDDTKFTLYESSSREIEIGSISFAYDETWVDGKFGLVSYSDNNSYLVNKIGTTAVTVNVKADETGNVTNIPATAIQIITNGLNGVKEVTNRVPTGNRDYSDTNNITFQFGKNEESDEELRARANDNTKIGGAATVDAIQNALYEIGGVKSVVINRNRESSSVDGLPAHSFEPVVYGGTNEDIANAIFNTASIDSHDVGGVNGQEQTYDIYSETTDSSETISWSSPFEVNLSITLDLVVSDTFVGEENISSIVANYIGGTDVDGTQTNGLDVGQDVFEAILKNKVVSPERTGVWEVDNLTIDANSDGTDDTTENTSGADVFEVANNEVALVNARDGSITVNTTQL
jgi:uncharacterized phage protein gp47/JayE